MTAPAIILGIVLSTIYGTAFHFVKGGSMGRIFLYIFLSWLGFWVGHFAGAALGWTFAAIGPLNTGMATVGSVVFLFVGEWLSRIEITTKG
jgi:uncharacterized membrane protein YeaQ/YmgE (transglycosylase-associated protein family)